MSDTPTWRSAQEAFWAGDFGSDYIQRNRSQALLAANLDFFAKALRQARGLGSCIEFGANIGMNLQALRLLFPQMAASAIEINPDAAAQLRQLVGNANVHQGSILDFAPQPAGQQWDLVFTKGVLIHINPELLPQVYDKMVAASRRWVLVAEYYNPQPVAIAYRGHTDRLFKRDFAGELLQRHPALRLVDYGFAYRHDPNFPQDDINWFLLEKH